MSYVWKFRLPNNKNNNSDDDRTIVMINRENIFNFGHTLFCISTPARFVNFYVSLHDTRPVINTTEHPHGTMHPRLLGQLIPSRSGSSLISGRSPQMS